MSSDSDSDSDSDSGRVRVLAPAPPADGSTVRGPASYFRSIEARYGRPVQEWLDLASERLDAGEPHMQVVAALKGEHGMGHGHANAVVAFVKSARARG